MTPERSRILTVARWAHGITASRTGRREDFERLLGPTLHPWDLDRPFRCWQDTAGKWHTQGISTCGLTAEGIWRLAGVDLPPSWYPYAPRSEVERCIARAMSFASGQSALELPTPDTRPQPGDYLCVGVGLRTHVCTVVEWDYDWLTTLDGGQVDPDTGLQAIKLCNRKWRVHGKDVLLGERRVNWWVCVDLLPWIQDFDAQSFDDALGCSKS